LSSNELLETLLKECFEKDVIYKITHPDLVEKIRTFLQAIGTQGIKIVPISVAVIAVLHRNRSFSMRQFAGSTIMIANLPAFFKALWKVGIKEVLVGVIEMGISPITSLITKIPIS
jgi:hypothetical protein